MPTTNSSNYKTKHIQSKYTHLKEKASAGFYQVRLDNNIDVKLTATQRVRNSSIYFSKKWIPRLLLLIYYTGIKRYIVVLK